MQAFSDTSMNAAVYDGFSESMRHNLEYDYSALSSTASPNV